MSRYAVLLIVTGLIMLCMVHFRPVDDADICWQIKLGELMLDSGRLVTADPFSYTHQGAPVSTIGWLAQLIFAILYRIGSWTAVQLLAIFLFAGTFALAGYTAYTTTKALGDQISLFSLGAAVTLGFMGALTSASIRPQLIGAFSFAVLLHVAQSRLSLLKQILVLIPLLLLWQNSHPSITVGAVALAALAGAAGLNREWGRLCRLLVLVLLIAVAQFATPMGAQLLEVSAKNLEVSRFWLGAHEWLPAYTPTVLRPMVIFWLALPLTIGLLITLRFRVRLTDLMLFAFMTALTLYAARFVLFQSVALVPVWCRWIERAKPANLLAWPGEGTISPRRVLPIALVGLVIALVVPPLARRSMYAADMPFEGIAALEPTVPEGRIYNYREWSGPLILAGHPRWTVAIDGRLYMYTLEEWRQYNQVALGKVAIDDLVRTHQPAAFFLHPRFHRALIPLLQEDHRWREVHADDNTVIFIPVEEP